MLNTVITTVLLLAIAGIVALYARSIEHALNLAQRHASQLAQREEELARQNQQLQQVRGELEQTVARQEAEIAAAVAVVRQRSIEMSALQTPLIRVAPTMLVAPLIGVWDEERGEKLLPEVLGRISRELIKTLVLDLTGITVMNETTARMLQQLSLSARLLGCRCVLAGVQPATAEVLVAINFPLDQTQSAPDLAAAVQVVLQASTRR
ncbi:MAG: STAS domain-containing protein [Chloroflexaceae bacterium]|nr:STAS domain-containing protein [Chloroflexaceae bacterium]